MIIVRSVGRIFSFITLLTVTNRWLAVTNRVTYGKNFKIQTSNFIETSIFNPQSLRGPLVLALMLDIFPRVGQEYSMPVREGKMKLPSHLPGTIIANFWAGAAG
jgi:hypothetical protein